ncbi:MAG: hypothetical protein QOJ21_2395 [Solirubrobacteraceae bacterium]|nr:hypothetical protein [Solirubrobacteraceae bacterium]
MLIGQPAATRAGWPPDRRGRRATAPATGARHGGEVCANHPRSRGASARPFSGGRLEHTSQYDEGPLGERAFRGGADDGVRTRDPQLGKLMLYQLSYVRR